MGKYFNPEKFGFDMSFSKRGTAGARGCYLALTDGKNLRIVLDGMSAERVREICGERVAFGMDSKGRVILAPPTDSFGRKLSKANAGSCKMQVAVGTMTEAYKKVMGTFVRLYMNAEVYDGGSAVVLTPTGEIDRV